MTKSEYCSKGQVVTLLWIIFASRSNVLYYKQGEQAWKQIKKEKNLELMQLQVQNVSRVKGLKDTTAENTVQHINATFVTTAMRITLMTVCVQGYLGYTSGFSLSCMVFFLISVRHTSKKEHHMARLWNYSLIRSVTFLYVSSLPRVPVFVLSLSFKDFSPPEF